MNDYCNVFLDADFSCEFPTKFLIDISSVCNLRCVGCPTARVDKTGYKGVIDFANFKIISTRSRDTRNVLSFSAGANLSSAGT